MQKGFAHLLLMAIFALVILGAAGAYSFIFKKVPTLPEKPVNETLSPAKDIIYRSDLGLTMKIPEGFFVKEETEEEYFQRVYGNTRKNFTYYIQYPPPEFVTSFYVLKNGVNNLDKASLSVVVFKNPDDFDPSKFYKEYWYYPFVWGDFTAGKNNIAPESIELIGGKEGKSGVVDYREGKPKFIYLPWGDKGLMLQIQVPSENNEVGKEVLESLEFK